MYAVAIHAGAGAGPGEPRDGAREQACGDGLARALAAAEAVLARAGPALDAVEAAVRELEDDPQFNAGRGAVLTREGTAELDAAIMDGERLRAGAVAAITRVRNPVQLARRVLEDSPHVFLVGAGAERFAEEAGLAIVANEYFITADRQRQLAARLWRLKLAEVGAPADAAPDEFAGGTVGAVARDGAGRLAAATSTGGMNGKLPGRVGDSPVIGAGTYADNESCAVSTTGHGEWFLRTVQAHDIAARLRYGGSELRAAVDAAIGERLTRLGAYGGLIAVDHRGGSPCATTLRPCPTPACAAARLPASIPGEGAARLTRAARRGRRCRP
jgi:beta-aspartyl-peptidase (threonine type)